MKPIPIACRDAGQKVCEFAQRTHAEYSQVWYHNRINPVDIPPGMIPGLQTYSDCRLVSLSKVAEEVYAKKCAPAKTVVDRGCG